jgi:hypothetical protein
MIAHADLDGLGALEGASIIWTIPANMRRDQAGGFPGRPAYGMAVQPMNLPTAARSGNYDSSWWFFAAVVCLAIFLVSRLKSSGKTNGRS